MKELFKRFEKIIKYFCYSCLSTVLDVGLVWLLFDILSVGLVTANTVGVVAGFILSYLLSTKSVFDTELGAAGFAVYFGTFLAGLVLADALISISHNAISPHVPEGAAFLLSKGISVVLPFFALYFARKYLYGLLHKKRGQNK